MGSAEGCGFYIALGGCFFIGRSNHKKTQGLVTTLPTTITGEITALGFFIRVTEKSGVHSFDLPLGLEFILIN